MTAKRVVLVVVGIATCVVALVVAGCGEDHGCDPVRWSSVADATVSAARRDGGGLDCEASCAGEYGTVTGCGESVDDAGRPVVLCGYTSICR